MSAIKQVHAREVLDSRGNPTLQVEIWTEAGGYGSAMVPSGASTGQLEAVELRDAMVKTAQGRRLSKQWFGGKGVGVAVENVNRVIAPRLIGLESSHQILIDETLIGLDGSVNKSKLGANALLGASLANLKASADERGLPLYQYVGGVNASLLPVPMLNVINGGAHASNTLDIQEFMIMPIGAKTFREAMQMANQVFHFLAKLLKQEGYGTLVGDEGGFAPNLDSHEQALEFLVRAIREAGYKPSRRGPKAIAIALDAAASEFYDGHHYRFKKIEEAIRNRQPGFEKKRLSGTKTRFTSGEMVNYWKRLVAKFPIISIEDGLAENDWAGFEHFTSELGQLIQIVGDDLTVTNPHILKKAVRNRAINSILIKLNQIGTVTETIQAIEIAHKANMSAVISHRSGETEDTTIADLAVALNTGQIKTGSLSELTG